MYCLPSNHYSVHHSYFRIYDVLEEKHFNKPNPEKKIDITNSETVKKFRKFFTYDILEQQRRYNTLRYIVL